MTTSRALKLKGTTAIGYVSQRDQEVVSATGAKGTDHNARIYELKCRRCGNHYGANGTDIHGRKCPRCQGGRPGLSLEQKPKSEQVVDRWSVADAKARFSEVIERAQGKGPQLVSKNGRDVAVIVSFDEWNKKTARKGTLLEMFQSAPEGFADLDFTRARDTARDIEL